MKRFSILTAALFVTIAAMAAQKQSVATSPDGQLRVVATSNEQGLQWSISRGDVMVMQPSDINITIDGQKMIAGRAKESRQTMRSAFETPFYKKANVEDRYEQMTLKFARGISVEFRVYNDGAAYRIVYGGKRRAVVNQETANFRFPSHSKAFIPYVNDNRSGERYCYSFESYYDEQPLQKMFVDSLAITPLAVAPAEGIRAVVMDAGVEDYPGMMLKGSELSADFAPYPLENVVGGYARLNLIPTRRADYMARLDGPRTLPWRAVVVVTRDADLLTCDMAQRLAPACRIADTSWIKPGKVAWDWWNNTNIMGVDFKSGMNTPTYKYYIDFAQKNHLEYIIIDEGWSSDESMFDDLSPEINIPELIQYGRERGVGIILWACWRNIIGQDPETDNGTLERVMQHYADMGIKGFKIDFFDRDDQQVIRSAYRIAEAAARHHLVLDLHGLKPFGIQRAYPNIFNFEGVKGLENSKWEPRVGDGPMHNQPRYDVSIPYLRQLCGPLDYTPGAMMNAMRDNFFGNNGHPMSQGTRAHQVAMYITFEAPLQMLADSPSKYMKEQETTDFISQIPTIWDETLALDGQLGEYTLIARRKGTTWYVAAMTDWTPRTLTLPLTFLGDGSHKAEIFADGVNAQKEATDYCRSTQTVKSTDQLTIRLSSGGGWAAIINSHSCMGAFQVLG